MNRHFFQCNKIFPPLRGHSLFMTVYDSDLNTPFTLIVSLLALDFKVKFLFYSCLFLVMSFKSVLLTPNDKGQEGHLPSRPRPRFPLLRRCSKLVEVGGVKAHTHLTRFGNAARCFGFEKSTNLLFAKFY